MSDSLLKRIAGGEMAAMQEFIDEYGGLIWSLARRLAINPAEADDAVQEVFISMWENASRFDETKGSEVTFVAMIARRRLIDRGRRQQRQQQLIATLKEAPEREEPRVDTAAVSDEVQRVQRAMSELSEDQQRVLKLAIHHGRTHDQIAQQTGLPLGTVKTHARRGLIRIRELLSGGGMPSQQTP